VLVTKTAADPLLRDRTAMLKVDKPKDAKKDAKKR
jgi:hypothetical protein